MIIPSIASVTALVLVFMSLSAVDSFFMTVMPVKMTDRAAIADHLMFYDCFAHGHILRTRYPEARLDQNMIQQLGGAETSISDLIFEKKFSKKAEYALHVKSEVRRLIQVC